MWNRLLSLALLAGLLGGAEPPWRTPGACLTPTGSLCRTLVYEVSGSRNWLDHYDDRLTEAVGRDGSAMLRLSHRSFKLYFMPDENYDRVRIVLPATVQTFEIEHSLKEFRELGGIWQFSEGWRVDPDCLMTAADAGEVGRKSGAYPMVAGVRAVEYVYSTGGGRFVQRMAFAPTLGCTAVEWDYSERSAV